MKLPKRVKAKWVKALRSGKYKQGHYQLAEIDNGETKFCCLGVACEIGLTSPRRVSSLGDYLSTDCYIDENFLHIVIQDKLVALNDGDVLDERRKPKSFAWIASYIERYL